MMKKSLRVVVVPSWLQRELEEGGRRIVCQQNTEKKPVKMLKLKEGRKEWRLKGRREG